MHWLFHGDLSKQHRSVIVQARSQWMVWNSDGQRDDGQRDDGQRDGHFGVSSRVYVS